MARVILANLAMLLVLNRWVIAFDLAVIAVLWHLTGSPLAAIAGDFAINLAGAIRRRLRP